MYKVRPVFMNKGGEALQIDGIAQKKRNALAVDLRLSCINTSKFPL